MSIGLALALNFASLATPSATYPALGASAFAVAINWRDILALLRSLGRVRWAWFYFSFALIATCLITAFPEFTTIQAARAGSGLLLALALSQLNIAAHARWVACAVALFGLALALGAPVIESYSVLPFALPGPLARISQLAGDSINPNVFAGVLAFLVPVPMAVAISLIVVPGATQRRANRALGLLLLLVMAFLVMLLWRAQSRGALMSAMLALWVVATLRWPRVGLSLLGLGVVAVCIVAWQIGLDKAQGLILSIGGISNKEGPESRIEIWSRAYYMIQDFMFTGIGMGSFEPVMNLLYPLILTSGSIPHAHNLFLQIAVDLGVPGLVAWLAILFSVCRACVRVLRDPLTQHTPQCALAVGLLAAQASMCAHGMVDAVLWGTVRTAPLVWMLWGIALGLERANSREKTPTPYSTPQGSTQASQI